MMVVEVPAARVRQDLVASQGSVLEPMGVLHHARVLTAVSMDAAGVVVVVGLSRRA